MARLRRRRLRSSRAVSQLPRPKSTHLREGSARLAAVHLTQALTIYHRISAEPARGPQDLPGIPVSFITDSLCGSTPMTTLSTTRTLLTPERITLPARTATLFRAGQTLLQPRPATAPGQGARQKRATPSLQAGSRKRERPSRAPPPEPAPARAVMEDINSRQSGFRSWRADSARDLSWPGA